MDIYGSTAARGKVDVPQTKKAAPGQKKNAAGGYTFKVNDLERAKRFLILGTDSGSFYASAPELTLANAKVIEDLATSERGTELVEIIRDISVRGIAPKTQPALFALAIAATKGNDETRARANGAVADVVRTGTHLLTYIRYVDSLAGWSRGRRSSIARWFTARSAASLAFQAIKYAQRDGWSMRDALRISHPVTTDPIVSAVFSYITNGYAMTGSIDADAKTADESVKPDPALPRIVHGYESAKTQPALAAKFIADYGLSWEMLPDEALNEASTWAALIDAGKLPLGALLRQLPRLTRLGVVGTRLDRDSGGYARTAEVVRLMTSEEGLKDARIHPLNLLIAQHTYMTGVARSGGSFTPVTAIVDAFEDAFYRAFRTIEPANKRTMVALDVSGSMAGKVLGSVLSAREVGAALGLVLTSTEPGSEVYAFSSSSGMSHMHTSDSKGFIPLNISRRQRLGDVVRMTSTLPFGGTDCGLPMRAARERNLNVDTFIVVTDNETWAGPTHPHIELQKYRDATGIDAKLVVLAVTPTKFSIADPSDAGMLDIVGFGSDVPTLVTEFSRGF
jgi:60 kDa SS-A/Ro ribonucleoprotein